MNRINLPSLSIIFLTFALSIISCGGDDDPKEKKPVVKPAVTVDLTDNQQVIRGFGGATAFRADQPISDQDMDKLFGTGDGEIGLNILRIRVATEDQWRGLELAHAKKAKARGAIIVASPWSPPAEMKTNGELVGGSLKTESYEDYANYLNDFATYMAENDAPLYAISIQNEPDIQVDYESCDWTSRYGIS
ncbi:MAG TPA: hypothetical protein VD884_08570 [Ohtaekwangia sp.]|nr:hypothetical protein [Ohtaekwangia sp.]